MTRLSTPLLLGGGIAFVLSITVHATGTFAFLWNYEAIVIVLIGSWIAASAGTEFGTITDALRSLRLLAGSPQAFAPLVEWWFNVNLQWRKDGILALNGVEKTAPDATAAAIVQLCSDGLDADSIERLARKMVQAQYMRTQQVISYYRRLAGYAPTMGLIGTVIGLASALANGGDSPAILLQRIGFAFSATLWGLITANFLWLPIAQRLEKVLFNQQQRDLLHIEAATAIARGMSPLMTRYQIAMLLSPSERSAILRQHAD